MVTCNYDEDETDEDKKNEDVADDIEAVENEKNHRIAYYGFR